MPPLAWIPHKLTETNWGEAATSPAVGLLPRPNAPETNWSPAPANKTRSHRGLVGTKGIYVCVCVCVYVCMCVYNTYTHLLYICIYIHTYMIYVLIYTRIDTWWYAKKCKCIMYIINMYMYSCMHYCTVCNMRLHRITMGIDTWTISTWFVLEQKLGHLPFPAQRHG